jgi:hypothetical protein
MSQIYSYLICAAIGCSTPLLGVIEVLPPKACNAFESTKETYEVLNNDLRKDPYAFLQKHKKCFDVMDPIKTCAEFEASNSKMRNENPLWALAECITPHCPLTRTLYNDPRIKFEEAITHALIKKSHESHLPVNYCSFASGWGLTDFIAIIKALDAGAAAINLHIIERQNQGYIATVEQFSKSQVEAFEQMPTLAHILISKIDDAKLKAGLDDDAIAEYLFILWKHELYSQIAHWIAYHYPKVKLHFFLYRDVAEYKRYIESHPELIADVVGAIDFGVQDQRCKDFKAEAHFNDLVLFVQAKNKNAAIHYDIDGIHYSYVKKEKRSRNCDSTIGLSIAGIVCAGLSYFAYHAIPKLLKYY